APLRQRRHMIGADEIEELRAGKTPGVIADGFHRIGNSATPDFLFVELTRRLARERESQQTQAFGCGRGAVVRFERRLRGGNEEQPRQLQFLARRLSDEQMSEMNRVERSAEKTEAIHGKETSNIEEELQSRLLRCSMFDVRCSMFLISSISRLQFHDIMR